MQRIKLLVALCLVQITPSHGEALRQTKSDHYDAFRQLEESLPTANVYRTASGAPGDKYWQQRADHKINVTLDENAKRITGSQTVTYTNNSPDTLRYLWLQLDQNRFQDGSLARQSQTATDAEKIDDKKNPDVLTYTELAREQAYKDTEHGYRIKSVTARGRALKYTIVDTMMRIDLSQPLPSGQKTSFSMDWEHNIINEPRISGRGGYEHFPETDTYIFFLAQWFPRMAAYTDYSGWAHKAFLGAGEFTLEFGNYDVAITVPADHIVSGTGALQNPQQVMSAEQRRRLNAAKSADTPNFIVTPTEALENEAEKTDDTKTWVFKAENVRDFAWSSSRKFIWDAMVHKQDDTKNPEVLTMSFYPNEAEPIWSKYSTHAVMHTMEVYSRFSFAYPYPTAQSVNTWDGGGMEYPMITFNGFRPEPFEPAEDEEVVENPPVNTYDLGTKYKLIGVIIHEIGHTYFPMVVNSDERQWTWMDEGLNSFLDYVAALEWEENYPYWGGGSNALEEIVEYMVSENQVPIMTQSDSLLQFSPNAYGKPTAALVVLRETVMGRELFDFAFKEYARRWKFKRPTPADFFRTMEDASGIDLDWFWRGWFYSTDHVDIAISDIREYQISTADPDVESGLNRMEFEKEVPEPLPQIHNRESGQETYLKRHPELSDFYNENDQFTVTNKDRNTYIELLDELEDWERDSLLRAAQESDFIYFLDFENIGGLVSPLPLQITGTDGQKEFIILPAELWRRNHRSVTKLLVRHRPIKTVELDPRHETADADFSNNHFPRRIEKSRLELYKKEDDKRDMMADMLEKLRERKHGQPDTDKTVPMKPGN